MQLRRTCRFIFPILLVALGIAHAQKTEPPDAQQSTQEQVDDLKARIEALEAQIKAERSGKPPAKDEAKAPETAPPVPAQPSTQEPATPAGKAEAEAKKPAAPSKVGQLVPGQGLMLAKGPLGEVAWSISGYVRYLNQGLLDDTYTDAFGRTMEIHKRQDIQLNRLQLRFRGFILDPRFRYAFYAWTQNTSMGEPAQVVVGGTITWRFVDYFNLLAGIYSVPTTRSTNQSHPDWIRIDHRTMADEFFRGSYSTGVMAFGKIRPDLDYKVSLTNNLSQLGISAQQLPYGLNTIAVALWWMPTTGEFGPQYGFGDYEYHEKLATLFGVHFTHSREDKQDQPPVTAFENTQIRLSDGTLLFGPDPFRTGGNIESATYKMLDLDVGMKLKGWSVEGEYYFRWVDDLDVASGTIPVDSLFDHGFQLQISTMLKQKVLQGYLSGSKLFGQYGNPWDVGVGLIYFPFARKHVRLGSQALYMNRSPVGYAAVPYVVGGNGWVFTIDLGMWF